MKRYNNTEGFPFYMKIDNYYVNFQSKGDIIPCIKNKYTNITVLVLRVYDDDNIFKRLLRKIGINLKYNCLKVIKLKEDDRKMDNC